MVYMTKPGYIIQKGAIYGKIRNFRSYLDYKGRIWMSPIGPRNHKGHPVVQPDSYIVHYSSLYDQTRRYHAKTTNLVKIGNFRLHLD